MRYLAEWLLIPPVAIFGWAFIRAAVLAALDSTCPLCKGSGILSPNQQKHWDQFSRKHSIRECHDCNEFHLVCDNADS